MKKILLIAFSLICSISFAQGDQKIRLGAGSDKQKVTTFGMSGALVEFKIENDLTRSFDLVAGLDDYFGGPDWRTGGTPTTDASELTTGVLPDGRVQQSNVKQHEGSLAITESQITDLAHTIDTDDQTAPEVNTVLENGVTEVTVQAELEKVNGDIANATFDPSPQNETTTRDLTLADLYKVHENNGASDIELTIVPAMEQAGAIVQFVQLSTGKITPMEGSGVTFKNYRETDAFGEVITYRYASDGEWYASDSLGVAYTPVSGPTLGPELWTTASAGNGNTNADLTAGFGAVGSSLDSVEDPEGGFIIQAVSTQDGISDYIRLTALTGSLTSGKTYRMEVRAYWTVDTGAVMEIDTWDGVSPAITPIALTNTPTTYTIDFTYNSGPFYARFYTASGASGNTGGTIRIKINSVRELIAP